LHQKTNLVKILMSDKTREKILTVATKLFGRYGFNKTSMDEIAKISRKAKGSLYYHFHSKEVLFTEVVRKEMSILREELIKVVNHPTNLATDKLKNYIITRMNYIEHSVNYNETLRVDFFEHYDFIDDIRADIDRFEKEQLEKIILQGIKEGSFKEPQELGVGLDTIIMLLKGMELTYFLKDAPDKSNPPFEKVADILIHGVTK